MTTDTWPTPKKPIWKRTWFIVTAVILGLFILIGALAPPPEEEDASPPQTTEQEVVPETTEAPMTTTPPTTTTTEVPAPVAADYSVTLRVVESQCFGSAGCNVTVVPELSLVNPSALGVAVDITIQIDGDEYGPIIETISADEDGNYYQPEIFMGTVSESVVPTVTITNVVESAF